MASDFLDGAMASITALNNPGAVSDGSFARSQPGYVPGGGRFAKFDSTADGIRAHEALLAKNYSGMSVNDAIHRYAPVGPENTPEQVANYVSYVSSRAGLKPTDQLTPQTIPKFAAAQREFEQGARPTGVHVAQNSSAGAGTTPPVTPVVDPRTIQPTDSEAAAMGTPRTFDIADPYQVGANLGAANQVVQQRAQHADAILQDVTNQIQAIQPQREAELAASVEAKKTVGDTVEAETQGLITRATPIFQRRQAIADRLVEVAQMNPFKRAIKGLFDPNYNPDYLRGQDAMYAGALSSMGENYKMMTGLQDRLTSVIEARHEGTDSVWRLKLDDLNEDSRLGIQSFGMGQQVLGAEMDGLNDQTALIQAQAHARTDTMNALSPGQVNVAVEQAKKNGGVAIVNGVPLRIGELTDLQNNWAEKDLALQSRTAALQSGNIELANAQEKRLIDHMSPAELDQAIRNGGVYQGQQLSRELLTGAMASHQQAQDLQVRDEAIQSAPGQFQQVMGQLTSTTRGSAARMMSLMGALPPEQQTYMTSVGQQLQGIAAQVADANAKGFGPRFVAEQLPKIQALLAQQAEISQRVINRWAGGNKNLAAVGQAWLSGQPIAGDAAVKGMIELARSGLPAGTTLRGPALETFREVQNIVRQADAPKAGDPMAVLAGRGNQSKEDKDRALMQSVQQAVAGRYNNNTMESALHAIPEIARQITGPDGKVHPFARVRSEDFQAAIQAGDDEGYRRIATELGLNPAQTKQLFAEGPNGALWNQVKTKKSMTDAALAGAGRTLQAYQTQAMMDALDNSPSASHQFRPSQWLADLMTNPQFQNRVGQLSQLQTNGSFGDYLASSASGGGFQEGFDRYSQGIRQAYITRHAATLQATAQQLENMRGTDPMKRAAMVLAGIPTISEAEEQRLLHAVRTNVPTVPGTVEQRVATAFGSSSAADYYGKQSDTQYDQFRNVILNQRFHDPALEAIRKRAAAGWQEMEDTVGRVSRAAR